MEKMSASDAHYIFMAAQKLIGFLDKDIALLKSSSGAIHARSVVVDASREMFINGTISDLMDAMARAGWWNRRVAKSLLDEILKKQIKCKIMASALMPNN